MLTTAPTAARKTPAHLSSASDNWPTPQDFFDALNDEFGFVLDVCASTTNHKAPAYYALDHHDPERRDGLAGDWAADALALGGTAWMNPPYGRPIGAWMRKASLAARAGAVIVTLVPVRADTKWWHENVLATGAEVRYVRGRLTFGDALNTAAFASAVVIYRPTDAWGAPGPACTMPAHPPRTSSPAPTAGNASCSTPRRSRTDAAVGPTPAAPLDPAPLTNPVAPQSPLAGTSERERDRQRVGGVCTRWRARALATSHLPGGAVEADSTPEGCRRPDLGQSSISRSQLFGLAEAAGAEGGKHAARRLLWHTLARDCPTFFGKQPPTARRRCCRPRPGGHSTARSRAAVQDRPRARVFPAAARAPQRGAAPGTGHLHEVSLLRQRRQCPPPEPNPRRRGSDRTARPFRDGTRCTQQRPTRALLRAAPRLRAGGVSTAERTVTPVAVGRCLFENRSKRAAP